MRPLFQRLPSAGVVMGSGEPLGSGSHPGGVNRVVDAVDSEWLQVTLDTGISLKIHTTDCRNWPTELFSCSARPTLGADAGIPSISTMPV